MKIYQNLRKPNSLLTSQKRSDLFHFRPQTYRTPVNMLTFIYVTYFYSSSIRIFVSVCSWVQKHITFLFFLLLLLFLSSLNFSNYSSLFLSLSLSWESKKTSIRYRNESCLGYPPRCLERIKCTNILQSLDKTRHNDISKNDKSS